MSCRFYRFTLYGFADTPGLADKSNNIDSSCELVFIGLSTTMHQALSHLLLKLSE
ncbi:hypothetical protein SynA1562_00319 [Synechococcus sp. A15-62]|nr:hypothetical protein SynA1562_00319 [Synechococcus sp. A15-62]